MTVKEIDFKNDGYVSFHKFFFYLKMNKNQRRMIPHETMRQTRIVSLKRKKVKKKYFWKAIKKSKYIMEHP